MDVKKLQRVTAHLSGYLITDDVNLFYNSSNYLLEKEGSLFITDTKEWDTYNDLAHCFILADALKLAMLPNSSGWVVVPDDINVDYVQQDTLVKAINLAAINIYKKRYGNASNTKK